MGINDLSTDHIEQKNDLLPVLERDHLESRLNPGEVMYIRKSIVPVWHESTLSSRQAACPLVRAVEEEKSCDAPDHFQNVLPQN
ncbi:hypothetical protein TNCV_1271441 [Trichonephila clavipes]|nr:hypothetical protein TNCV_1271441 [Trichonephila clavipes]